MANEESNEKVVAVEINNNNNHKDDNKDAQVNNVKQAIVINKEPRKMINEWLNRLFKVKITDGRIIQGIFLCTDKHSNVILGSCQEYIGSSEKNQESRTIGLCMVPGNQIVSVEIDVHNKLII